MCKPAIAVQGGYGMWSKCLDGVPVAAVPWVPPALSSFSPTPPCYTVSAPAKHGCSLPQTHFVQFVLGILSRFHAFPVAFVLSLYIPLFLSYVPFSETTSAYKNGPLWNAISVDQESVVALKKDNIMRYISKSIIKIFGKSILFYAKCFRLTFKYVKVSAKRFNFQCLVSDHKLSKNVESESTGPRKCLVVRVKEDGKG